jgi:hypothetical protein
MEDVSGAVLAVGVEVTAAGTADGEPSRPATRRSRRCGRVDGGGGGVPVQNQAAMAVRRSCRRSPVPGRP